MNAVLDQPALHGAAPTGSHDDARLAEAERQRRLMSFLWAPRADLAGLPVRETGARALRGLQAYRANAQASAARALATAFPTLRMLLGEDDFAQLAREFWHAQPPLHGDLGQWGGGLPTWIAGHAQLAEWPYLGDCARLDWAVHECERAADAEPDRESLMRLNDTEPSRLTVVFQPGFALIESTWPIAQIHHVHRHPHGKEGVSFDAVRQAISERRGESVAVSRHGWKAIITVVDAASAAWTGELLTGRELAAALQAAHADFDFARWLGTALQQAWLAGIAVSAR